LIIAILCRRYFSLVFFGNNKTQCTYTSLWCVCENSFYSQKFTLLPCFYYLFSISTDFFRYVDEQFFRHANPEEFIRSLRNKLPEIRWTRYSWPSRVSKRAENLFRFNSVFYVNSQRRLEFLVRTELLGNLNNIYIYIPTWTRRIL